MNELLTYINGLTTAEQEEFASKCGTSIGYIRKTISQKRNFGESLCILFERETLGAVTCEQLRPDLLEQWNYIRGTANNEAKKAAA